MDAGPTLLVQKRDGIRLCEELGLGPRSCRLPAGCTYGAGRLHRYPRHPSSAFPQVRPFVATRLFLSAKLRVAAERSSRGAETSDESISGFVTYGSEAKATTYLAEPLLTGIHAGDVNRLSIGRCFHVRRCRADPWHLLRAFQAAPRAASPTARSGRCRADWWMIHALTLRLRPTRFG